MTGQEMAQQIPWGIVTFLTGLIVAWSMMIIVTVRWQVGRILKGYDTRFQVLEQDMKKHVENLSKLQAALPLEYMRREDHIRQEVIISAKLDRLYELIDARRRGENGRNRPQKSQE